MILVSKVVLNSPGYLYWDQIVTDKYVIFCKLNIENNGMIKFILAYPNLNEYALSSKGTT